MACIYKRRQSIDYVCTTEKKLHATAAAHARVSIANSTADSPKPKLPTPYGLIGSFSGKAADAVAFHIWDCAGQSVFNALHSLFMSGRVSEVRVLQRKPYLWAQCPCAALQQPRFTRLFQHTLICCLAGWSTRYTGVGSQDC